MIKYKINKLLLIN